MHSCVFKFLNQVHDSGQQGKRLHNVIFTYVLALTSSIYVDGCMVGGSHREINAFQHVRSQVKSKNSVARSVTTSIILQFRLNFGQTRKGMELLEPSNRALVLLETSN